MSKKDNTYYVTLKYKDITKKKQYSAAIVTVDTYGILHATMERFSIYMEHSTDMVANHSVDS
jgi:hypothetical protein